MHLKTFSKLFAFLGALGVLAVKKIQDLKRVSPSAPSASLDHGVRRTSGFQPVKLDRLLAKHQSMGRNRARQAVVERRVQVNGVPVSRIDLEVDRFSRVEMDGAVIRMPERLLHLMLHKPLGVVSATVDAEHRTVIDLIDDPDKASLHLVGRLDRNTSGLVLLTNDGRWSKPLMAPGGKVPKTYLVETLHPIPPEAVATFAEGFHFHTEDITTLPAELEF